MGKGVRKTGFNFIQITPAHWRGGIGQGRGVATQDSAETAQRLPGRLSKASPIRITTALSDADKRHVNVAVGLYSGCHQHGAYGSIGILQGSKDELCRRVSMFQRVNQLLGRIVIRQVFCRTPSAATTPLLQPVLFHTLAVLALYSWPCAFRYAACCRPVIDFQGKAFICNGMFLISIEFLANFWNFWRCKWSLMH